MHSRKNILQGLILIIITTAIGAIAANNQEIIIGQVAATDTSLAKASQDESTDSSGTEGVLQYVIPPKPVKTLSLHEIKEEAEEETDYGPVEPIAPVKAMYVQNPVNVRLGPGLDYEKIDRLQTNYLIAVDGRAENGWYRFNHNGQVAFLSNNYVSTKKVDIEAREAALAAAAEAAALAAQTSESTSVPPQGTQPQAPQVIVSPAQAAGVIMVGDSRCVQMQEATGGGGVGWVCENAKGYKWLTETAIGKIDPYVGKGTKVVFCLGVNDPGNAGNYAAFVNQKAAEWALRGAKTYYVSCNPVWENPYTTAEQVATFNATMPGALSGVRWINTCAVLEATGYRLVDGLHYDAETNVKIFGLIIGSL